MKTRTIVKWMTPALMILAALAFVSCQSSDPVAISGSDINLTAQPNPVAPGAISVVQALVTSANGVPEEGVSVLFSAQNGSVDIDLTTTNSAGRAFTNFTNPTPTTATVTAKSGGVTKPLTITVTASSPTAVSFSTADSVFNSCGELISFTGQVVGSGGLLLSGQLVSFQMLSSTTPTGLTGPTFVPTNTVTDSGGNFSTTFQLNSGGCSTCGTAGTSCVINVQASVGSVLSLPQSVTETL